MPPVRSLPLLWWLGLVAALVAPLFAYILYWQMMQLSEGNDRMREIAQAVREGAMAYLRRQYRVVAAVFAILFGIFLVLAFFRLQNPIVPFAFLTGGLFSGLCGASSAQLKTATNASCARTAFAATKKPGTALCRWPCAAAAMGQGAGLCLARYHPVPCPV